MGALAWLVGLLGGLLRGLVGLVNWVVDWLGRGLVGSVGCLSGLVAR